MYQILERDVPEQRFLTEQRHVLVQDLPGWLATSIGRLIESAGSLGGQAGPTTVIYHGEVNEDSDGPVEACVPIAPDQEVTGYTRRSTITFSASAREAVNDVAYWKT